MLDLSKAREGDEIFLKSLPFDPMDNEGSMAVVSASTSLMGVPPNGMELYILKLRVASARPLSRQIPHMLSTISPINVSGAATRPIVLSAGPEPETAMKWFINGVNYNDNPAYFPFNVTRNTVEVWEITNEMDSMPHPMHLHGFQFQVLKRMSSPLQVLDVADADGKLPTDKGWKDTVLIWPGETVEIAIDFSHNFAGVQDYVFHCHNLEHEEQGMMVNYRVL